MPPEGAVAGASPRSGAQIACSEGTINSKLIQTQQAHDSGDLAEATRLIHELDIECPSHGLGVFVCLFLAKRLELEPARACLDQFEERQKRSRMQSDNEPRRVAVFTRGIVERLERIFAILRNGDRKAALAAFIREEPDKIPYVWIQIGHLRRDLGQRTEAVEAWRRFLDLQPGAAMAERQAVAARIEQIQRELTTSLVPLKAHAQPMAGHRHTQRRALALGLGLAGGGALLLGIGLTVGLMCSRPGYCGRSPEVPPAMGPPVILDISF